MKTSINYFARKLIQIITYKNEDFQVKNFMFSVAMF